MVALVRLVIFIGFIDLFDWFGNVQTVLQIPAEPPISQQCRQLLLGLLTRDPRQRISFENFFSHPLIALPLVPDFGPCNPINVRRFDDDVKEQPMQDPFVVPDAPIVALAGLEVIAVNVSDPRPVKQQALEIDLLPSSASHPRQPSPAPVVAVPGVSHHSITPPSRANVFQVVSASQGTAKTSVESHVSDGDYVLIDNTAPSPPSAAGSRTNSRTSSRSASRQPSLTSGNGLLGAPHPSAWTHPSPVISCMAPHAAPPVFSLGGAELIMTEEQVQKDAMNFYTRHFVDVCYVSGDGVVMGREGQEETREGRYATKRSIVPRLSSHDVFCA